MQLSMGMQDVEDKRQVHRLMETDLIMPVEEYMRWTGGLKGFVYGLLPEIISLGIFLLGIRLPEIGLLYASFYPIPKLLTLFY